MAHEDGDRENDESKDHVASDGKVVRDTVPTLADFIANRRQCSDIGQRSNRARNEKCNWRHLADTGNQRDECSNERGSSADRDRDRAATREPALGAVEISRRNQQVLADMLDGWAPTDPPDCVGDQGSGDLTEGPEDDHNGEVEVPGRREHARKAESDLRRDRNASRLDQCEEHERDISLVGEEIFHQPCLAECHLTGLNLSGTSL